MSSLEPRPYWPPLPPAESADWPLPVLETPASPAEPFAADAPPDLEGQAFQEGYTEGLREGILQGERKARAGLEALMAAAAALQAAEDAFRRHLDQNLLALALAVAEKLTRREVTADPSIVRDLVQQALTFMPAEESLEVRLHPADLHALGSHLELYEAGGTPLGVRWLPDPSLERGSFLLESPHRLVDGRVDTALRRLYEAMLDG